MKFGMRNFRSTSFLIVFVLTVSWNHWVFGRSRIAKGQWSYIDKVGKIVLTLQHTRSSMDAVSGFFEGLARVGIDEKIGYIDAKGRIVIQPRFDWAGDFSEGLAAVGIGSSLGYIDKTGALVIEPRFDLAQDFSDGLAAVFIRGKSQQ